MNIMILAQKIVRLRKQVGWSQEELAEKMNVSRQSVSKWEATNSIPDLNKIIMLAELFEVSTDYLLKEDVEIPESLDGGSEAKHLQISLEQALDYVENKIEMAVLNAKGAFLLVCSAIPFFALLALSKTNTLNLTTEVAATVGIVIILLMVSIGISFFIRASHLKSNLAQIENESYELAYGVHSVIKEKLEKFRSTYNLRLSIGIFMFIFCSVPLTFTLVFSGSSEMILIMTIVMIFFIAIGIYIVSPVSAKYDAYNCILKEGRFEAKSSQRTKRVIKVAAFYWPLITAIYLGWSLWTMNWGITWIVWPVTSVLFASLIGLMELLDKENP